MASRQLAKDLAKRRQRAEEVVGEGGGGGSSRPAKSDPRTKGQGKRIEARAKEIVTSSLAATKELEARRQAAVNAAVKNHFEMQGRSTFGSRSQDVDAKTLANRRAVRLKERGGVSGAALYKSYV